MYDEEVIKIRALISTVILKAIKDSKINGNQNKFREIRDDAQRWLTEPRTGPYSFAWCCEMLNIDKGRVFAKVESLNAKHLLD